MFDPVEVKWSEITQANILGFPPSSRHGCGLASLNGAIYLFGGKDEQRKLRFHSTFVNYFGLKHAHHNAWFLQVHTMT